MWEKNMYDSNEPLEHGSECFLKIVKFYLRAYLFDRIYSIHIEYKIQNLFNTYAFLVFPLFHWLWDKKCVAVH